MKIKFELEELVPAYQVPHGTLTWCQNLGYCIRARNTNAEEDLALFVNIVDGTINRVTPGAPFRVFPNAITYQSELHLPSNP
jgi:hypothetical protein